MNDIEVDDDGLEALMRIAGWGLRHIHTVGSSLYLLSAPNNTYPVTLLERHTPMQCAFKLFLKHTQGQQ